LKIDWPRLLRALTGEPEPRDAPALTFSGELSMNDAYQILLKVFPGASIYMPDLTYKTAPASEVQKIIDWSGSKNEKYLTEQFDCDDFAWLLMGSVSFYPWSALPFGTIWTNKHALNFFIDDQKKLWFVEPQNGKIQDTLEAWQGDSFQLVIM
jgi:hypothetical protein